jgi:hypothetical protein
MRLAVLEKPTSASMLWITPAADLTAVEEDGIADRRVRRC